MLRWLAHHLLSIQWQRPIWNWFAKDVPLICRGALCLPAGSQIRST
jgi:hypothetical protein